MGFPLTGVDAADPIPGIIREIRFSQGSAGGSSTARDVLLIGNKVSSGTETENAIGAAVSDQDNAIARVGYRSELLLMYRAYVQADPDATIYFLAVPEGGSATASTVTFTLTYTDSVGPASAATVAQVSVLGEVVEVAIATGDVRADIAANIVAAINAQLFWPLTAAVGGSGSEHVITVTCANKGPRGDYVLNRMRIATAKEVNITVTKGSVTSGTVDDDLTTAITVLDAADIYYHVLAKTTLGDGSAGNPAVSATDNGVGEYAAFVLAQCLPSTGKAILATVGLGGTSAQATTVASAVNNVRVWFPHAINPEWTPAMLAAHATGVRRSREIAFPAANLTGHGLSAGEVFYLPDPFNKADRLTRTEIRAELNNGVTPIAHTSRGQAYIVRQVTSACLVGGQYNYTAREGHIPSCGDAFWANVYATVLSQAQEIAAEDPPQGAKPLPNVDYPRTLRAIVAAEINRAINFPAGPFLDPGQLEAMKSSVEALLIPGGFSIRAEIVAARHNNKQQFLFLETSGAA